MDWGRFGVGLMIAGKTQMVLFDWSGNTCVVTLMTGLFLKKNNLLKMLGFTFSSKLDRGSNIISIAKTTSKKIGTLICFIKFISPGVALYFCNSTIWVALHLYNSTIQPCMEYCCHACAGAPSCYLELLDKLQKWIFRIVGPSLAVSLEPLTHSQNVASLSLFFSYCFGRCSSELDQLLPLPYS